MRRAAVATMLLIAAAGAALYLVAGTGENDSDPYLVAGTGENDSDGTQAESSRPDPDQQWILDLDHNGTTDLVTLTGDTLEFFVTVDGDPKPVLDRDGRAITVELSDTLTFTCQSEGLLTQDTSTIMGDNVALRLSLLTVEGVTGDWQPSPSFFFPVGFVPPQRGKGC